MITQLRDIFRVHLFAYAKRDWVTPEGEFGGRDAAIKPAQRYSLRPLNRAIHIMFIQSSLLSVRFPLCRRGREEVDYGAQRLDNDILLVCRHTIKLKPE
jgi:hypothetical protein